MCGQKESEKKKHGKHMQVMMKVYFTTILLICMEQLTEAINQGMPVSPCPKVFQYRFDGSEWYGLIAVRNPDVQALQIRVTLSMRGKPTTNYLGEIELLTRGKFAHNAPVLYKIRFPKHNFPPKLVLISANNQVVCFGFGDHSIFMTQIQLEHTRKLTFIPEKKSSDQMVSPVSGDPPANHEIGSRPLQHIQFKKKPFHSAGGRCGKVDKSLDFRLSPKWQRKSTPLRHLRSSSLERIATNLESRFSVPQSPTFVSFGDYDNDGSNTVLEEVEDENDEEPADSIVFVDEQNVSTDNTMPSITRGAWPWLAAIYVNNLTSLDFQCGGTLVSARVVISSAHCFQMFNQRYTANEVLVFLGRHNLKNWNEEGSLAAPVNGIYIHSDYNKELSNYDADIAAIILKDKVRFNTFIQPVCLWSGSTRTEYIVGEHGIVVGWTFDRTNSSTFPRGSLNTFAPGSEPKPHTSNSIPIIVKSPIISNEVCFKANAHFRGLSSNRTFCAEFLTDAMTVSAHNDERRGGPGLYTGISGAGLMILRNNRWMLRGTVSAALPFELRGSLGIDTDQYILYADVAKFIDWIIAFII